jgi:glycosyltransferase involved in cell wall biosynthesis
MDLPSISVLIPVYKRHQFLNLTLHNIKTQTYPHGKITVIIDECKSDEPFITDIDKVKKFLSPIQVVHKVYNSRSTIGEKRNRLVKTAKTKYVQFFDSDDIYRENCLIYNYCSLKENNVKCVGSDKMIFCYVRDDFKLCSIDCNNKIHLIHEATLFFDRKWFNSTNKFQRNNEGEGKRFFEGLTKRSVFITDIDKIMICLVWGGNTISKEHFKKNLKDLLDDNIKQHIIHLIDPNQNFDITNDV